jgi:hypothetical protein
MVYALRMCKFSMIFCPNLSLLLVQTAYLTMGLNQLLINFHIQISFLCKNVFELFQPRLNENFKKRLVKTQITNMFLHK